jgi:glycosyltransferase involved in cell wall biosynthesis
MLGRDNRENVQRSGMRLFFARIGHRLRNTGWRGATSELPEITLVGNPFEAIGRSEHLRTIWRALQAASVPASIYDVYGLVPENAVTTEMGHCQVSEIADGIRIFHLNGDEIQSSLRRIEELQAGLLPRGYNIVAPAWELPQYPDVWARELDRFDEIWAPTAFVEEALRRAASIPVFRLRNACEPHVSTLLGKPYFGIPPDSFAILYLFDLRSYTSRKNPWSTIEAFRRLIAARPAFKVHLVLKLNYSASDPHVVVELENLISHFRDYVTVIDATLSNNETKNLVRCCDCFLSLHRSEGFGRGPAEAMFFGKPVVATGWSGNMEYMREGVAFPVRYSLQAVKEGEYPHFENQVWADPDVSHAVEVLIRIIDNPKLARAVGRRARSHMRRNFSDVVLGATYRRRLEAIAKECASTFRRSGTPRNSPISCGS